MNPFLGMDREQDNYITIGRISLHVDIFREGLKQMRIDNWREENGMQKLWD